ncbi:hypothetical protein GCM10010306_100820 [Streptomyces umbrinus]|uniref:AfsR/SARP family transcriptional regulator n=1 Tax=Streptomyces umbrinus TaxID=67370 RepID=UPI0019BF9F80|nr:helix-turn-helix domain-containing protein [Streptomyces umbrinus]GHB89510.1 hypothetical protein GCM10010306_100820 [Streptomyces umbrinus]
MAAKAGQGWERESEWLPPLRLCGCWFSVCCGWRDGVELDPGPRQQSYLLAILLARAGKSISTSELIDLIWGDRAPSSALNILQKYVCALRRLLDPPQWGIAYHWALLAEMWLAAGSHDRAEAALDRAVQTMRDYGLRYAEPPPNDSSQDRGPCLTAGPEGHSGPGMRSGADLISPAGIPST